MSMTQADRIYTSLLNTIIIGGEQVSTRNSDTTSHFTLPNVTFTEFPLVTLRKTAVRKAILEMEWFMSGQSKCPVPLLDWWNGQLDQDGFLIDGYAAQFRQFTMEDSDGYVTKFDQVRFILEGLRNFPNSRRLLLSCWNPGEMANIIESNNNPNTPTCCHSIVVQFFVRSGRLHMKTYQRSADMLLGVPHNWVQSWAMLMYFAHHSGLEVGSMTWMWGDAHIYSETSHMEAVKALLEAEHTELKHLKLVYSPKKDVTYGTPQFLMEDFTIVGAVPAPIYTGKVNLL